MVFSLLRGPAGPTFGAPNTAGGPVAQEAPFIYKYTALNGSPPAGPQITTAVSGDFLICSSGRYTLDFYDTANASFYPLQRRFQWKRNGVNIPGAFGQTYSATDADSGNALTCVVYAATVENPSGGSYFTSTNSVSITGTRDPLLVYSDNFEYLGAFRLAYGVGARPLFESNKQYNLAWNPAGDSGRGTFIVDANSLGGQPTGTCEVAPPRLPGLAIDYKTTVDPTGLSRGTLIQGPVDQNGWADNAAYIPTDGNGVTKNGAIVYNGKIYRAASYFYPGIADQVNSHAAFSLTLSSTPLGVSPVKATGYVSPRTFAGSMAEIPNVSVGGVNYRTALGGPVIGGAVSLAVISNGNGSYGLASYVFDPSGIDTSAAVTANVLLKYADNQLWDTSNEIFPNPIMPLSSAYPDDNSPKIIPKGTRSLLFVGEQGAGGRKYGTGNTVYTVTYNGSSYNYRIYDPNGADNGFHTYPYFYTVMGIDLADLKQVKDGLAAPDSVKPYTKWHITIPYTSADAENDSSPFGQMIDGVYSPSERTMFIAVRTKYTGFSDEGEIVMHGFRINNAVL